jgi:hypothetical protein
LAAASAAKGAAENVGASETLIFKIAEPEPGPVSTTSIIVPIASVAFVGVGLLVYFKKRKRGSI